MSIQNHVQKIDGPYTFQVSLWQGSIHANGIRHIQFVDSNNYMHVIPQILRRNTCTVGRTQGRMVSGEIPSTGTEIT